MNRTMRFTSSALVGPVAHPAEPPIPNERYDRREDQDQAEAESEPQTKFEVFEHFPSRIERLNKNNPV